MAATVIGLFDNYDEAEAAVQDLMARDIDEDMIEVKANRTAQSGTGKTVEGLGGLLNGLTSRGVPQEHAELYSEAVRRGGTLVTVHAPNGRENEITPVLDRHNAVDIDERGQMFAASGYTGYSESLPAYTDAEMQAERTRYMASASVPTANAAAETLNSGETMTIPIVEEQIVVGKREVSGGGARVRTYVTETPVSEQITLREEHVTVERTATNRELTQTEMENALTDRTIEVTEMSEEAVVGKTARVVGEVTIGKEVTERTETVSDTVRRTDVDVVEMDADAAKAPRNY